MDLLLKIFNTFYLRFEDFIRSSVIKGLSIIIIIIINEYLHRIKPSVINIYTDIHT